MPYTAITVMAAGCVAAGVVTLITLPKIFKRLKKFQSPSLKMIELAKEEWVKIGTVKELFVYPIMCGKEIEIRECEFQENGLKTIIDMNEGSLRDKMFVIYDEETHCVQTCRNFTAMLRLRVTAIDKYLIRFKEDNDYFTVDLRSSNLKSHNVVECKVWNNPSETLYYLECIDCGSEAASWISGALTGKSTGLRLGYYKNKTLKILTLWDSFGGLREIKDSLKRPIESELEENKQLPVYTMVAQQSLEEVNKSLLNQRTSPELGANFVILTQKPFSECQYDYLKIGENVMVANIKPWKRPRINPMMIPNDLKIKLLSVHCKVINPGKVKVNDDVYIRASLDE
ncbi:mitochondrial amidoxime reducing component 2 [Harpegnathos saltator]|uniref:MOSC domain-containing protein 2, mitochondrial n=1 Tax=Harpegnathos saltator TaxID=610380 RepID=E2BMW7_HARSA|nr:mitochondrial amidoxime reducing component 2 [Harpegnathos saltator]EFN82964.1 MOSC domain-containing protein 2, mitochondrial [Harpegnathos saltator]